MKKLITYKDTFLTLSHYKEPLREIPSRIGYGYYGTLLATIDGQKIQCHLCGKLFAALGAHVHARHHISARAYRQKFQLAHSTALVSEVERQRMKMTFLKWLSGLTLAQKEAWTRGQKEYLRRAKAHMTSQTQTHPITLETMNKRGTCPDQLLDKIMEVKKKLGRVPTSKEFVQELGTQRYKHLIYKVFGSWNNALKQLGLQPKVPEVGRNLVPMKKGMSIQHRQYDDEELLMYLASFAKLINKIPTYTDFKRGLLPPYMTYLRHFKTIENARKLAGVYELIRNI